MPLETMTIWHWWALAGGLLTVELFVAGFFFLWLGASAALTGLALLAWPAMPLGLQFALFAGLSLACVLAWRRFRSSVWALGSGRSADRAAHLIGRRAHLLDPIENGRGRLQLGDGSWAVTGPDLPAGSVVEVTGAEGPLLQVRPI